MIFDVELYDRFPFPLDVRYWSEVNWELLGDFVYLAECGLTITAEKGFYFDMGSVPNGVDAFVSKVEYAFAYTIHDKACKTLTWDDGTPMTRLDADNLFLEVARYVIKVNKDYDLKYAKGWWKKTKFRIHWGWKKFKAKRAYRWIRRYAISKGME